MRKPVLIAFLAVLAASAAALTWLWSLDSATVSPGLPGRSAAKATASPTGDAATPPSAHPNRTRLQRGTVATRVHGRLLQNGSPLADAKLYCCASGSK